MGDDINELFGITCPIFTLICVGTRVFMDFGILLVEYQNEIGPPPPPPPLGLAHSSQTLLSTQLSIPSY